MSQGQLSVATDRSVVDATVGHEMLSFLDAFSEYHQIPMVPKDEEKIVFITPHGLYYYKVM